MKYVNIKNIKKSTYKGNVYNLHVKDNHNYFANDVMVANCHKASAKKLKYICNNAINAHQRIGLTGTLKKDKIHPLQVQANFGDITNVVSTKQLQEAGRATDTLIHAIRLKYSLQEREMVSYMCYQEEIDFLINHEKRNDIILKFANTLKGNSLFLFSRVDDHLIKVHEKLKSENSNVYMIHGKIKSDEREDIKKLISNGDDIVLLATYATLSTGINIKKLHNLVLCSPIKSVISVLQSIGRIIRLHDSKSLARIFDLYDDLKFKKPNITLSHFVDFRLQYYKEEKHELKSSTINM